MVFDNLLGLVQQPQRYIGGELGSIIKEHRGKALFALALPEPYEVGASHYGSQIIYHILNGENDIACERVFCPGEDMAALLKKEGIALPTLESRTALSNFDIVGFSLSTELSFSNVLLMLELAKIPLRATERTHQHPFIIAGGPSVFNPEPLADFIDLFFIGDAEASAVELTKFLAANKNEPHREDILREAASRFEGVYVPSLYRTLYTDDGRIKTIAPSGSAPTTVRKAQIYELKNEYYPSLPVVPWMKVVHDRFTMEIMRGCPRGCRFCMAGWVYRPVREREPQSIVRAAADGALRTGWEEMGLLALSATDYTSIAPVMKTLSQFAVEHHISLSLPSLRTDRIDDLTYYVLGTTRKSGLTFAPEAGTDRLRSVINKPLDEEIFLKAVELAVEHGWRRVKLYFMVGLPTETDDDIEALANLSIKVANIMRKNGGEVKLTLSPFVPKPHTPFQWERQSSPNEIEAKYNFIRSRISRKAHIRIDARNPFLPFLEGVFARGDRRLGKALLAAFRGGARFDAWDKAQSEEIWLSAFDESGIDPQFYTRERDENETFPYETINPGFGKENLLKERHRAYNGQTTPDCRQLRCDKCSRCDFERMITFDVGSLAPASAPPSDAYGRKIRRKADRASNMVRVKYAKVGRLKWLSHLDEVRAITRAINRAEIPVEYTKGFHQTMHISFGPPVPIGLASRAQYMDIHLKEPLTDALAERLKNCLPDGITIIEIQPLVGKVESLFAAVGRALWQVELPDEQADRIIDELQKILMQKSIPYQRFRKVVDIKPLLHSFGKANGSFWLLTEQSDNGSGRPNEYLEMSGWKKETLGELNICREELIVVTRDGYFNPLKKKIELPYRN